jgi:hypothetical protein
MGAHSRYMAVPDFSELLQAVALILPKNETEHSIQKAREVIAKVMALPDLKEPLPSECTV